MDDPLRLLRELKGAPLSCLLALAFAGGPAGVAWLRRNTGYSDNSVRDALDYLRDHGLAQRNGRYQAWVLSSSAQQLPFAVSAPAVGDGDPQKMTLPATTATCLIEASADTEEAAAVKSERTSKNEARLKLLHAAGVNPPMDRKLLAKSWMTEDYIRAHVAKAQAEGSSTGLLIHRMRSHDPIPRRSSGPDAEDSRRSPSADEFADFIQH